MDASETNYPPGDPRLIDKIVCQLKSQGIFDQFRKECMADVDTKPAYQNLHQRVEASVSTFLAGVEWRPDLSKNQLRENLRKHINESGFLEIGVERIVDQVVNPKIRTVFLPHVEEVVYSFLGLERPKQAKPMTNSSMLKPPMNDPPLYAESKPPEPKKVVTLSDLLPQDLDPVSPESDTCELTLKLEDDVVDMEFSDGETDLKDKKPEEDTSPAFEPLLDENSNGSHISGMSGFSSHDEGQLSPVQQGVSGMTVTLGGISRPDQVEKMEVEMSCKSESESGADKVSSTVEENVPSPAQVLTHNMSTLDIQEPVPSGDRLMDVKDEKCDSSMDSVRNEKEKDSDKEKESRRKEKADSKSSKSGSDKDKHKSSDKIKHDSKDKKTEKEKLKHEENKSRPRSETRKEKESGSKKEKVGDGKKDKALEIKKDKKTESSKSDHRDSGSKKEKDTGGRKEKEHESRKDKDNDKKHDKDGDKKKDSDREKSKSEDISKSKHDDKGKIRNKGDTKHGKDGKDKSQTNKDDKYIKSAEKKSKSTADLKSKDVEKKDSKEKSASSTHKRSGDQKPLDDTEKKDRDKKGKTSVDHTMHGDDKHSSNGDNNQKSKDKSKKGRTRTKTPDDMQSTDGESDTRSRDSCKKAKDSTRKRFDDQVSTDGESDHKSRDSDKGFRRGRHKNTNKEGNNEDRSETGNEGSSKDGDKKRKERRSKGTQDDHHMHHSRRDHDRRSADRDSSGSAPQSGSSQAQRQGRSSRQESSSPRKSSKTSDTNSSATDATENMHLQLKDSSGFENQDTELSPTSSLPFKKRPLLQDTESENNVNNNLRVHDRTVLLTSDVQGKVVAGVEEVNCTTAPKQVEKQKLGEIEKSLRSEVDASLANNVPNFDSKLNGMLYAIDEDEESDVLYFKSCDDSIFDDRDRQYINALKMLRDKDGIFTKSSNDDEITICAVSQCFDEFAKTADEVGIKVVRTLKDIQVYTAQEEQQQESANSFKDILKNRRYMVRLSDDINRLRESTNQPKIDDVTLQPSTETSNVVEQIATCDYARSDNSPDDQAVYRSASDEDTSYDGSPSLSSDLILPSLQDLMRESGMVPSPNTSTQMGTCRRVGLPRPTTRKSDSGGSSGGACLDKKNGMSSDRRLLRSSVGETQRYSSEDLYKPRPLFSHGSRRNRHNSDEQASRPVAIVTACPSSCNKNLGVRHESSCSDCDLHIVAEARRPPPSSLKASAAPSPPEAVVGSNASPATSPHVVHHATAPPIPPPLTVFLSLPRIQSRLLACRSARSGGTRAAQ